MSKLDKLRANIESGGCDQREGAAELLAVADATLGMLESTPENEAFLARKTASAFPGRPAIQAKHERCAAAWEALT